MFRLLFSFFRLLFPPAKVKELAWENLALRQQLAVMKRRRPRPRLRCSDRLFWVWLSRIWPQLRRALLLVQPETVVGWHQQAFRFFWTWISSRKQSGRPAVSDQVSNLMRRMAEANPYFNPKEHPTSGWIAQQLREAFPEDTAPGYLILDRDRKYEGEPPEMLPSLTSKLVRTSYQGPWQNGVAERWGGLPQRIARSRDRVR